MRRLVLVSLFGTLLDLVLAKQAANFNVTREFAEAHACGNKCQRLLNQTNPADLAIVGKDFDFDFYATAANFSGSKPGDVLKFEPLDPHTLSVRSGTTAYRFQYTSLDVDGSPVPVTGFIAFPYTPHFPQFGHSSSNGTYRLVAFAHGTIGLYAGCAPSNGPNFDDYNTWQALVERGYAVVGTDYAGLGNNYTSHKYLSFQAHATDVYYSIVAARKLFGNSFTKEWMSMGHSQGGGAAWKLAESKYVRDDKSYLGTVALAPATYTISTFSAVEKLPFVGYVIYIPTAVARAIPSYKETFLSETLRKRLQIGEAAQLCINALIGLTLDVKRDDVYTLEGIERDRAQLLEWQKMSAPAQGDRSPAPIFVGQGLNDTSVLPGITEEAWKNSCDSGNEVHLSLYPGQEHPSSPASMAAEWLAWIDARFAGVSTHAHKQGNCCSKVTRHPFNSQYVKEPTLAETKPFYVLHGDD